MFSTRYLTVLLVALFVFSAPSAASAKKVTLTVGATAVKWDSAERFGRNDSVIITISFRGKELDSETVSSCMADFSGHGIVARVNTCGNNKPIRARFANARKKPARVTIDYRKL